ncbi:MAG: hypothetical protein DMG24_01615 [Acidobacteria bacterium]|nr:MAG: hypothetical protein DMG24_01615 [Acidobacteriota bacterium]
MSFISSGALSQESKASQTGPERYQPNQKRITNFTIRRFIEFNPTTNERLEVQALNYHSTQCSPLS